MRPGRPAAVRKRDALIDWHGEEVLAEVHECTITARLSCVNNSSGNYLAVSKLIDEQFDGVTLRLATALDMKPPQLHRWLSGGQGIREDSARKIEERLELGHGWLDGVERPMSYAPAPALRIAEPTPEPSAQLIAEHAAVLAEQAAQLIAEHAAVLAEQAARVAQLWMQLPPGKRADYLAALAAEVSGGDTAGTRVTVGRRTPPARPSKSTGKP